MLLLLNACVKNKIVAKIVTCKILFNWTKKTNFGWLGAHEKHSRHPDLDDTAIKVLKNLSERYRAGRSLVVREKDS